MLLHRIALAEYSASANEAFSGNGGLYGKGRWHTKGHLIVYVAEHRSLAMSEALVHIQRSNEVAPFSRWEIEVPDTMISPLPTLPSNWSKDFSITQTYGDRWLESKRSVAHFVPSAIIPEEMNCLINPAHPDFSLGWVIGGSFPFHFDPRLTQP